MVRTIETSHDDDGNQSLYWIQWGSGLWRGHETGRHLLWRSLAQHGQAETTVGSGSRGCSDCHWNIPLGVSIVFRVRMESLCSLSHCYPAPESALGMYSAPISKVIDYLPKQIPRILINRTIVHPPESVEDQSDRDDDGNDDFRKNYVFDAYLLGDCDLVTQALSRDLFHPLDMVHPPPAAQLLTTLLDTSTAAQNKWTSVRVPAERVFVFPGAQAPPSTDPPTWLERAHCDGCTKPITTGTIQKCVVCFDYDLCPDCFPTLSQTHYNGEHAFAAEAACSD
jgi:Zinc finger, ZZ type